MELDQLKALWQKESSNTLQDHEKLSDMIKQSSAGPVSKMKRNLRFELYASIIAYGTCGVYFYLWKGGTYFELSAFYLILGIAFFIYYFFKMRLLNNMQCLSCTIKKNLQLQLRTLKKYVAIYLWVATLVVPVLLIYSGWFSFHKKQLLGLPSKYGSFSNIALPYIGITIFITILLYFLNRYHVQHTYGRHIKRLETIVAEMEDAETQHFAAH
ncbi:MAG: hypothetical protein ICV65_05285 [Flavisolibacter sp.]|nr:hypothetical protein [Flavisolibacter sp.]